MQVLQSSDSKWFKRAISYRAINQGQKNVPLLEALETSFVALKNIRKNQKAVWTQDKDAGSKRPS